MKSLDEDDLDLCITVDYLKSLSPSDLQQERFKHLRKALFPLFASLNPYSNPSQKVTLAFESKAFDLVLFILSTMRAEGVLPKLGSTQRWIRLAGNIL